MAVMEIKASQKVKFLVDSDGNPLWDYNHFQDCDVAHEVDGVIVSSASSGDFWTKHETHMGVTRLWLWPSSPDIKGWPEKAQQKGLQAFVRIAS